MDPSYVLNLVVLSGLIGFAFFCISYTLHMWKRRRAGSDRARPEGLTGLLTTWGPRAIVLGMVMLAGVLVFSELTDRTGLLDGDGLFTVRAHKTRKLQDLAATSHVRKGDVLAHFYAPEDQARADMLALDLKCLAARREAIKQEALELDPELVRAHAAATSDKRQWTAQLASLVPARALAAREEAFARLDREVQLRSLDVQLERLRGELAEVKPNLEYRTRELALIAKGHSARVATELERLSVAKQVETLKARISRLDRQAESVSRQRQQVTVSLETLEKLEKNEQAELSGKIEQASAGLTAAGRRLAKLDNALAVDRTRAEQLRAQKLAQVRMEIDKTQAELKGLRSTLETAAPFSGRVAYREPAPNAAMSDQPVLVLAPEEGFRIRMRLPSREVGPLRRAGAVVLELAEPRVQRRLAGRMLNSHPLPHDSDYQLVELACDPPAETIRWLAAEEDDNPVEARLLWRPPLWTLPLGPWGIGLVAMGLGMWIAGSVSALRRGVAAATPPPADAAVPALSPAATGTVQGPEDLGVYKPDRAIQTLANRLAASLDGERPKANLLSAVECALDCDQTDAARLLHEELQKQPIAIDCLQKLARQADGGDGDNLSAKARLGHIAWRIVSFPDESESSSVALAEPVSHGGL